MLMSEVYGRVRPTIAPASKMAAAVVAVTRYRREVSVRDRALRCMVRWYCVIFPAEEDVSTKVHMCSCEEKERRD